MDVRGMPLQRRRGTIAAMIGARDRIRRGVAAVAMTAVCTCAPAAQSSYVSYRTSCPGSVGVPQLSADAPSLGSPWTLTVVGLRPGSAGQLIFALSDDSFGPYELPFDLADFGAPGCSLNVTSDPAYGAGNQLLAADAAGRAVLTASIPNTAALMGFTFHNQYVSLDAPPGRALPIATTNAGRGMIGIAGLPFPSLVPVAAGSFAMGSTRGVFHELPVHTVQITRPFWIGQCEVRQDEWQAVMGTNPSRLRRPDHPVERVSWNDAIAYCAALSAMERAAGRLPPGYVYRLPTEAEWEYACRAGTTSEWNTGWALTCADANFYGRVSIPAPCVGSTARVESYAPNAFGLHDAHGNVLEWCLDAWDRSANYPPGPVADPLETRGPERILRGGSFPEADFGCRSARRASAPPGTAVETIGFRVALAPELGG
jgi:formylglycine-generating enzyme required for sulfatase activity